MRVIPWFLRNILRKYNWPDDQPRIYVTILWYDCLVLIM